MKIKELKIFTKIAKGVCLGQGIGLVVAVTDAVAEQYRIHDTARHRFREELVASGLEIPWGLAFLPDGRLLVTEKGGRLGLVTVGDTTITPVKGLPPVDSAGQGGLLDVTLHPGYEATGWIYFAYTEPKQNAAGQRMAHTVIARARLAGDHLQHFELIYQAEQQFYRQNSNHVGSRIVFDHEGYLYFSIGDRSQGDSAQNVDFPGGKIHRLHDDGRVPEDNPFVDIPGAVVSIWSYGHRNSQGLAVDPDTGTIWSTEHGPKGGDELNMIRKGMNYGWPAISYGINYDGTTITDLTHHEGMQQPVWYWTPSIAVCGIDFYHADRFSHWNENLLVTALGFKQLRRVSIEAERVIHEEVVYEPESRVRDVETGPDGLIYVALEGPGRVVRLVPIESD